MRAALTIDHNEAVPKYLVTPTNGGSPAKRTLGDAGASQSISECRLIIDPISKLDGMLSLRNVDGECLILTRNDIDARHMDADVSTIYAVFIGSAINGSVVTTAATEAQFLAAMVQIDIASPVRNLRLKTRDVLTAAGAVDARYMTLITEAFANE